MVVSQHPLQLVKTKPYKAGHCRWFTVGKPKRRTAENTRTLGRAQIKPPVFGRPHMGLCQMETWFLLAMAFLEEDKQYEWVRLFEANLKDHEEFPPQKKSNNINLKRHPPAPSPPTPKTPKRRQRRRPAFGNAGNLAAPRTAQRLTHLLGGDANLKPTEASTNPEQKEISAKLGPTKCDPTVQPTSPKAPLEKTRVGIFNPRLPSREKLIGANALCRPFKKAT